MVNGYFFNKQNKMCLWNTAVWQQSNSGIQWKVLSQESTYEYDSPITIHSEVTDKVKVFVDRISGVFYSLIIFLKNIQDGNWKVSYLLRQIYKTKIIIFRIYITMEYK